MNKFEMIYLDILDKIDQEIYPAKSILPSEPVLSKKYQVSRETIRKALKLLEERGYIQKKQGLGSIVLDNQRLTFPISGLTSYKELQQAQNFSTQTIILKNERVPAPQALVEKELVAAGEDMIHLIRLRVIDNEPAIIDEDYIRQSVVDSIPDQRAQDSIYDYFEKDLELVIAYASKEIRAEIADTHTAQHLGISGKEYVINVRSYVYLEDTTFFQYTISHHKIEKFRFYDFARRQSI